MIVDHSIRGNSRAAIGGRAARVVRQFNAWKVSAGVMSRAELRRWARNIARAAASHPEEFNHWSGVVRKAPWSACE